MRKKTFSEEQIALGGIRATLLPVEEEVPGMGIAELRRLRQLEVASSRGSRPT